MSPRYLGHSSANRATLATIRFIDGNKRTAWVAARLFLADNHYVLRFDPVEAVKVMEVWRLARARNNRSLSGFGIVSLKHNKVYELTSCLIISGLFSMHLR